MAGFFGKVPMRGDFVRRSLPESFIKPWDRWLQAAIAGSREILGDEWLDAYLTSPVWRFALSADMAGEPAAGVLIPSVDSVGRYFPFTLGCVLHDTLTPVEIRAHAQWFDDAESLALTVLADDASFDHLVSKVEELGGLELAPASPSDDEGMRFADEGDAPILRQVERSAPPHGLLWTSGSQRVQPSLLLIWQLPSPRRFTALLDGAWAAHGWTDAAP
jgi:type VI secretion system protein ImpM